MTTDSTPVTPPQRGWFKRHARLLAVLWLLANVLIVVFSIMVTNALGGAISNGTHMNADGTRDVQTVSVLSGIVNAICFVLVFNGFLAILTGMAWGLRQIPKVKTPPTAG